MAKKVSRRDFIQRSGLVTTGAGMIASNSPLSASSRPASPPGANDRIRIGFVGMGGMGRANLRDFLRQPDVEVAALCDVYKPNLEESLGLTENKPESYSDFRRVLDRQDIDAIVISSPDHWHPLQAILSCKAGKDVYVEKPISVAVEEGRKMVEAARKYNRIVQVGTQQRSGIHFQRAVQLIQEGAIGKISYVKTWNYFNEFPEGIGDPPDSTPPEGLDWDLWLGPATKVPFNINRFGVGQGRWSTFRYFWDYAGGMMTDWGVHLLDIVQWAMKVDGPKTVSACGGKYFIKDNRDTPDTIQVTFEYPGWICVYESRSCNGNSMYNKDYGIEFHGTTGTLFVDRSGFEVYPEVGKPSLVHGPKEQIGRMKSIQMRSTNNSHEDHVRDFLDSVKSRKLPRSDIEIGHRSTSVCQLGNVALRSNQRIVWDATKEEIIGGDTRAKSLLTRKYRKPWKLMV